MNSTYYHVSRKPLLTAIKPTKFDITGRMPERAVFVTDADHINHWTAYIRDGGNAPLYLYEITLPDGSRIEEGPDGEEHGDWKVITDQPLACTFLRIV